LVSEIGTAALSRAELPEVQRTDFLCISMSSKSSLRWALRACFLNWVKYRVGLVLAQPYLSQNVIEIREAILGNVGTILSFRLGVADAEIVAKEFAPEVSLLDLNNLPNHTIYLKLKVDGVVSRPFSAETLSPACLSAS
jgi:hypothetical protein